MKQFLLRLVILAGISFLPTVSNAQLREKAEELLSTTLGNEPKEPVTSTDTFSLDEQHRQDSRVKQAAVSDKFNTDYQGRWQINW